MRVRSVIGELARCCCSAQTFRPHAVWSLGGMDAAGSDTEGAFCENKYKISVFCMNKRTGFHLYFNIFIIKNRGGAFGSKICGDSGVAVGSCLAREHKRASGVERYVVMFNQCEPILVDRLFNSSKIAGQRETKAKLVGLSVSRGVTFRNGMLKLGKRKLQNGLQITSYHKVRV